MSPDMDTAAPETPSFEVVMARLEEIVHRLEAGGTTLEECVALFNEGRALASEAERLLDAAEMVLSGEGPGETDGAIRTLPEGGGS